MKVSSAILMTAIATQCSLAEDFYLKHEATGKMYGPYSTTQGAEVKIGKTVFIVAKPEKTESEAKYWLDVDSFEAIEAHTYNMSPADKRVARRIIFEHFDYLVSQWNEFQEKKNG